MPAKNKVLAALLLLLAGALAAGSCALQTPRGFPEDDEPRMATAEDANQEEVLSEDDDEEDAFGRRDRGPQTAAGELLVVIAYIGMIVGSTILPLLLL